MIWSQNIWLWSNHWTCIFKESDLVFWHNPNLHPSSCYQKSLLTFVLILMLFLETQATSQNHSNHGTQCCNRWMAVVCSGSIRKSWIQSHWLLRTGSLEEATQTWFVSSLSFTSCCNSFSSLNLSNMISLHMAGVIFIHEWCSVRWSSEVD